MPENKKNYTTSEIAKLLTVRSITVARWIDAGKLEAFFTPGGHRRVTEDKLQEFLVSHNMPLPSALNKEKRILLVDDDEQIIDTLIRVLKKKKPDCLVEIARDGFAAGQAVSEFHPDLIVLDIMLPKMDGIEVCHSVRKKNNKVKILAMTGYYTEEVKKNVLAAGADYFMEKPFEMKFFLERLNELLGE